ncbi:MAG: hypothetical protein JSW62_04350 [Thermoplasmatales archaeon]|nr:MAG: hypothetical protein JSW62_04350 [Thermoplasmatales archaeon]
MKHRACMIVLFTVFIMALSSLLSVFSFADDTITIKIHMIDEETRTRFNDQVIVAGIWHYVNVTIDLQGQELILKFYEGNSMPSESNRDENNYYEWKYDNNQQWVDVKKYSGYTYINNGSCQKTGNTYSFCIGINSDAVAKDVGFKNWTLDVYKDGNKSYSETVVAETPVSGLGKSGYDTITFDIAPFTEMDDIGSGFFKIWNEGNTPLYVSIDYGAYNDVIEIGGFNETISPYNVSTYDGIIVHSESWKPGTIKIDAPLVRGTIPDHYIITTAPFTFSVESAIESPDLEIFVGHSNYELYEFSDNNITFQYVENLEMSEGEIKDINVYISGNGILTLDLRSENLTILNVFSEDVEKSPPLTISSVDTSEHSVRVRVKALRENDVAFLYYHLEIDGKTQIFYTQINVGPPESTPEETAPFNTTQVVIVLMIVMIVILYMLYSRRRYRRG